MKSTGKWFLVAAAIIAAVIAYSTWTGSKPIQVSVTTVALGQVQATVSNTRAGTVDACRRAGMSPSLGGQIAALPVREGDAVKTGQIILELDQIGHGFVDLSLQGRLGSGYGTEGLRDL